VPVSVEVRLIGERGEVAQVLAVLESALVLSQVSGPASARRGGGLAAVATGDPEPAAL
jgi:hypothetical protein